MQKEELPVFVAALVRVIVRMAINNVYRFIRQINKVFACKYSE